MAKDFTLPKKYFGQHLSPFISFLLTPSRKSTFSILISLTTTPRAVGRSVRPQVDHREELKEEPRGEPMVEPRVEARVEPRVEPLWSYEYPALKGYTAKAVAFIRGATVRGCKRARSCLNKLFHFKEK